MSRSTVSPTVLPGTAGCSCSTRTTWPLRSRSTTRSPARAVQQRVERLLGACEAVAVGIGRAEQLQPEALRVDALRLGHEGDRGRVQVRGGEPVGDALLDARFALAGEVDEPVGAVREPREQRRAIDVQERREHLGVGAGVAHELERGADRDRGARERERLPGAVEQRSAIGGQDVRVPLLADHQVREVRRLDHLHPGGPRGDEAEREQAAGRQDADAARAEPRGRGPAPRRAAPGRSRAASHR